MNRKIISLLIVFTMLFSASVSAYGAEWYYGRTPLKYRIDSLEGLIEEIQEEYKDETSLDQLFSGIYKGLFDSLGDQWSVYYSSEETKDTNYTTTVDEEYKGIGIVFRKSSNGFLITATISGSPAHAAGIQTGDYILKVGTTELTKDMPAEDVSLLIRGEPGSSVTLTISRDGEKKLFTVKRSDISNHSVSHRMLDDNIGYIDIDEFISGTAIEFKAARSALIDNNATALIIDLRDNMGGLLYEAIEIADEMISSEGIITKFLRQGKIIETIYSSCDNNPKLPCIILTNENTASSSELLAAALKERGIAETLGINTYGKGCAQLVGSAGNGAVYRLSLYYFLTPSGENIDGTGVKPDYLVYNYGGFSEEEALDIRNSLAPMTESIKYIKSGDIGLNIYAAQQRLKLIGYDVDINGTLDNKTLSAIKIFQEETGLYPYGGLDFTTMKKISEAVDNYLNPDSEDIQLEKAAELLSNNHKYSFDFR